MAKAKCWYKNIKAGDVLEVKFGPKHIFAELSKEDKTVQIEVTGALGKAQSLHFYGNMDGMLPYTCSNQIFADFAGSATSDWSDVQFIRKVKTK